MPYIFSMNQEEYHMGGFFGVVAHEDCVTDLFYGTDYHSHLGTKRGGLAVYGADGTIMRSIHDITNSQFRSKFDDDLPHLAGKSGIGVISDYEDQPLIIGSHLGIFAIVTVGKINNIQDLISGDSSSRIAHFFSEMSGGEFNPTEVVAALINTKETLEEGIEYAQSRIDGSCSMLILRNGVVYAARDRYGRTPIVIGRKTGAYAACMESSSFPNLDYTVCKELGPGEIVRMTADGVEQIRKPGDQMQICSFFWVYFGYPSSNYEGSNTETVRYRNGALMARASLEDGRVSLPLDAFRAASDAVRSRVLLRMADAAGLGRRDISRAQLEAALDLAQKSGSAERSVSLPRGARFLRAGSMLTVELSPAAPQVQYRQPRSHAAEKENHLCHWASASSSPFQLSGLMSIL